MNLLRRIPAIGIATGILLFSFCQTASAFTYWHGVRSDDWNDGISGSVSNWYSAPPPNGGPLNVPKINAMFAKGALRLNIVIRNRTGIGKMQFEPEAPVYTFRIARNRTMTIDGAGIVNKSNSTPKFTVLKGATLLLNGTAALRPLAGGASASIEAVDLGAGFKLGSEAKGGNAIVLNRNNAYTHFLDRSTAERMTITSRSGGETAFFDRSSPERAHLINLTGGYTSVAGTDGPSGNGVVPVGRIDNNGQFAIGDRTVNVEQTLTQGADGSLKLIIRQQVYGSLSIEGQATLDGELIVNATSSALPGTYKVIVANARTGQFSKLTFSGPSTLKARLAYSAREVRVIIEPK